LTYFNKLDLQCLSLCHYHNDHRYTYILKVTQYSEYKTFHILTSYSQKPIAIYQNSNLLTCKISQGIHIKTGKNYVVVVRMYNESDRRIISEYELIPVYSNLDIPSSFTAMRTSRA